MILGLHHVQITIPKGEEKLGKKFYCNILGLKETEKPNSLKGRGGFWLKVGNKDVHVGTENSFDKINDKSPFSLSGRRYCPLESCPRKNRHPSYRMCSNSGI